MRHIYKKIIINYIQTTLCPSIIKDYALSNNFNITDSESIIIYNFIKSNYLFILNGEENKLLLLKNQLRPELYQEIIKLYQYYKKKFSL